MERVMIRPWNVTDYEIAWQIPAIAAPAELIIVRDVATGNMTLLTCIIPEDGYDVIEADVYEFLHTNDLNLEYP